MSDYPRTSYSRLQKLSESPEQYHYEYILGNRKESDSMNLGKVVHKMVLEPQDFDKEYYVNRGTNPTGKYAEMVEQIAENYNSMSEIPINDENLIMQFALQSGISHKKDTVMKNFQDPKYMSYLSSLLAGKGKTIIDEDTVNAAHAIVDSLKTHPLASTYIFDIQLKDNLKIYLEKDIVWNANGVDVKSIIDILVVNVEQKKALNVDLKTSRAMNIPSFKYSCKKYGYDKQASMYEDAIHWFLQAEGLTGFDVNHIIVSVRTEAPFQVQCFDFDEHTINAARDRYLELIDEYKWRYKENKWFDKSVYEGNIITLDLTE